MKTEESKYPIKGKGGRIPKDDPAVYRYSVSFNAVQHARFLSLFEQSGMQTKAHFIISRIFDEEFRVIHSDQSALEYYAKLTTFYAQFRGIGTNYNQVVKMLHSNFSEKKALAFLYKLERATLELVDLNRQIIELTQEFEKRWLPK